VGGDFDRQLSSFLLKIALPCLIVKSLQVAYSPSELCNCILLLALALAVLAIQFVLGHIAYLITGKTSSSRLLRFGMMFSNFGFMGIPVVEALYGEHGLFYFVIFSVPFRIFYYGIPKLLLAPPGVRCGKPPLKERLKGYFSPLVVAVFVGLALYLTSLQLPGVLASVIQSVGSTCSPLGMILCGLSLGKYDFKKLLRPRYLLLPLIRNLVMPAVFLGLTRLLPLDATISGLLVIFAALPVASLMAAYIIKYDPPAQLESAGSVLISTLLSAFTIPLWAFILSL
jgi:predicted permease